MKNLYGKIMLFYYILLSADAQIYKRPEINVADFIQKISPLQLQDLNYEQVYENLYSLYQNPIDLNKTDVDQLRSLFFLSEIQINALLKHLSDYGPFLSIYELQSVEHFDLQTIRMLLPFVVVNQKLSLADYKNLKSKTTEHYLVLRADQTIQKSIGYLENKYLGSPQRIYFRYRMSHVRDFNIGFISEKDSGEKNILDYSNFHVQIQNKSILKNLVLGDYLMQFGQGLIFSAGYAPGKGSEPVYFTRRSNLGIRPYNSIVENNSFRGIANTLTFKNIEISTMYSRSKKDVTLPDSTDEFRSLIYNGFHRTESEINHQNQMTEQNIGANVLYRIANIQVGFSALATTYNKAFQKRQYDYNNFEFTGKQNFIVGPNLSIAWQNFNFFGEAARSSSGGYGYIYGLVASLSSNIDWAFNVRNYQPNFHTQYGSAFSEGSRTINEKGIYTGLKYMYKKNWVISTFYDSFKFPWLKYRIDMPSIGYDYQVRIQYIRNKKQNAYVAFHHETKQLNQKRANFNTYQLAFTHRNSFVIGHEIITKRNVIFQTKFQLNDYRFDDNIPSKGYAIIQDIEKKMSKFQYAFRLAYFRTDSWDSRVYTYENDVRYAVSFPAYYGNGFRIYLNAKYPVSRKVQLACRFADTFLLNQAEIGSANDKIYSNHKSDVRLQIIYNLK